MRRSSRKQFLNLKIAKRQSSRTFTVRTPRAQEHHLTPSDDGDMVAGSQ